MNNKRKLVVFYSYTGHTKMIAMKISKRLNCDTLELKPKIAYSDDYQKVVDEEQNSNSADKIIEIQDIDIDLGNYDEIIIGSPVWWYTMAPAVRTFLKDNDLSGKEIRLFATNAGWLGHTFNDMKKMCSSGMVDDGMNIVFDTDYKSNRLITSDNEISRWIDSL